LFCERLTQLGKLETLFDRFNATLRNAGYLVMSGQILDATMVASPKLRNIKADIWTGRIPQSFFTKITM
jgi:IS5 family transposase